MQAKAAGSLATKEVASKQQRLCSTLRHKDKIHFKYQTVSSRFQFSQIPQHGVLKLVSWIVYCH